MATQSSIVAWEILWTDEPGRLQSMGSQRVGHDWATKQQHPYFAKIKIGCTEKVINQNQKADQ